MKKTFLKDDNGKSLEVDLKEFLDHLNEYHKTGSEFTYQIKKLRLKAIKRWMCVYSER